MYVIPFSRSGARVDHLSVGLDTVSGVSLFNPSRRLIEKIILIHLFICKITGEGKQRGGTGFQVSNFSNLLETKISIQEFMLELGAFGVERRYEEKNIDEE